MLFSRGMEEFSVHDNRVVAYEVDSERRRIVLHTRFDEVPGVVEHTDVVFEGVHAYRFEHDTLGNILFDIEEYPLEAWLSEEEAFLEQGRQYGWPGTWNDSSEAALTYLRSVGGKAFMLSSSCGLSGWVVSASCRYEAAPKPSTG